MSKRVADVLVETLQTAGADTGRQVTATRGRASDSAPGSSIPDPRPARACRGLPRNS